MNKKNFYFLNKMIYKIKFKNNSFVLSLKNTDKK